MLRLPTPIAYVADAPTHELQNDATQLPSPTRKGEGNYNFFFEGEMQKCSDLDCVYEHRFNFPSKCRIEFHSRHDLGLNGILHSGSPSLPSVGAYVAGSEGETGRRKARPLIAVRRDPDHKRGSPGDAAESLETQVRVPG